MYLKVFLIVTPLNTLKVAILFFLCTNTSISVNYTSEELCDAIVV